MSRILQLRREINRDKQATKKIPKLIAFGGRLPSSMQVKPFDKKAYLKWKRCERMPERLASMAAVWQGITHLRSTKAYCEYLFNEKPDFKPPKYLLDSGMMDPKSFMDKGELRTSEDSFGNVSRNRQIFSEL